MPNKYHYLNLLAEIRDYLRSQCDRNGRQVDPVIVSDFNVIAKKLGSTSEDWMTERTVK